MRGIEHLTPETRVLAQKLVTKCEERGLHIKITDTLRTKQEQDELYALGRTKSGSIVTNTKYPNSMHNWGVAFDICRNDGRGAYNNDDGFFDIVGQIGISLGLIWGGTWTSIVDKPHFQIATYGNTPSKLIQMCDTPDNFLYTKQETTKQTLNTIKYGSRGRDVKIVQAIFNLDVDGIFGNKTKQTVIKFQKQNNLDTDGIVGCKTWQAIINTMMVID